MTLIMMKLTQALIDPYWALIVLKGPYWTKMPNPGAATLSSEAPMQAASGELLLALDKLSGAWAVGASRYITHVCIYVYLYIYK